MFTLPASVRIYVAAEPVDLRRSFDGLAAATRNLIGANPLSGHAYIFLNRRRNSVKLLVWDRTGYLIVYKRLERGTFALPTEPRNGRTACRDRCRRARAHAGRSGSAWRTSSHALVSRAS